MVGIDIVKISRIEEAMKNSDVSKRFLNKQELDYVNAKSETVNSFGFSPRSESIAGIFAAKEAVYKAFGIGMFSGNSFKDILVLHYESGKPYIELSGKIKKMFDDNGYKQINVSITHDGEYAVAMVQII